MKVGKHLLLALAGLGLFSCQKDDVNVVNQNDNLPVTAENSNVFVRLDLGTTGSSRSTGSETTPDGGGSTKATVVNNIALFFVDAHDKIVKVATEEGAGLGQLTGVGGKEYTNVPGGVKYVYGVGNYKGKSDQATGNPKNLEQFVNDATSAVATSPKSVADLKALSVHMSTTQDLTNAIVYGADLDGLKTLQVGADSPSTPSKFQAEFTLNHLVSRIEVKKISCEDVGNWYQEIKLKHIGIANYYMQTPLSGDLKDSEFYGLDKIGRPGTAVAGKIQYAWGTSKPGYDWSWDAVTEDGSKEVTFTHNGKKEVTFAGSNLYVYQFVPSDVPADKGDIDFNLKLVVEAKEKGGNKVSAFTTVTGNFAAQAGFYQNTGKIYKVNLTFNEDNITGWDPDKENNVNVKVDVQDWEIVANVTPDYE